MEKQSIIEGNKSIADFMNLEIIDVVWGNGEKQGQSFKAWRHPEVSSWIEFGKEHWLKYHLLWDWLMPVVGKVRGLVKNTDFFDLSNRELSYALMSADLNRVWLAVVEFIKYYNNRS